VAISAFLIVVWLVSLSEIKQTAIRISLFCYKPRDKEDKIGCSLVYSFFNQMSPKNKIRFCHLLSFIIPMSKQPVEVSKQKAGQEDLSLPCWD